jgi:hypothetical protein
VQDYEGLTGISLGFIFRHLDPGKLTLDRKYLVSLRNVLLNIRKNTRRTSLKHIPSKLRHYVIIAKYYNQHIQYIVYCIHYIYFLKSKVLFVIKKVE